MTPDGGRFRRTRTTWLCYGLIAFVLYVESALGVAMPRLREELGVSLSVASLHFTAVSLGSLIVGLTAERIISRWGRRGVIWLGFGVMLGAATLLLVSPWVVGTILTMLLFGMAGGIVIVTTQAHLAEFYRSLSGVALGEANVAASAGSMAATLAVGAMVGAGIGWRAAVLASMVILLATGALSRRASFVEPVRRPEGARPTGRMPRVLVLGMGAVICEAGVTFGIAFWGAEFLIQRADLSDSVAATLLTVFYFCTLVTRIVGSRLMRRISSPTLITGSFAVTTVAFPLLWLGPHPVINVLGLALVGVGVANVFPALATFLSSAVPGRTDFTLSRLVLAASASIMSAPLALGALGDAIGVVHAFGMLLPLLGAGTAIGLVMVRMARREQTAESAPAADAATGAL